MILDDLRKIELFQTKGIAADSAEEPQTLVYLCECLKRFFKGDYGTICKEDTEANNKDLEAGEGHILARYRKAQKLRNDIYIEAHFDAQQPSLDANYIMIMYCDER